MKNRILNVFRHRALVQALVARELKARYRSSILGFLWSFLNPLLLMGVYATVFTIFLRFGMPNYASFLLTGLLPWIWFSTSVNEATVSVVSGGNLIKKVMFPAEVLPLVCVLTNLIHYLLSLIILIPFLVLYGSPPPEKVLELTPDMLVSSNPVWLFLSFAILVVIQLIFTYGIGLALSALTVHLRDIQHIVLNLMTLWFFASPIIYPAMQLNSKQVPSALKSLAIDFNPIAYLVIAHHKIFILRIAPSPVELGAMLIGSLIVLFIGYSIFEKFRDSFDEEV